MTFILTLLLAQSNNATSQEFKNKFNSTRDVSIASSKETKISDAKKVTVKSGKVTVFIDKQYNYISDTSKTMSDKPEIELFIANNNPYYISSNSNDSIVLNVKITCIGEPIAKNLVDYSSLILFTDTIVGFIDQRENEAFNESYTLYNGKFCTMWWSYNNIYDFDKDVSISYPNRKYYLYLNIGYTDRYGKRPDNFRKIFLVDLQGNKMTDVPPKEYKNIKSFLIKYRRW